MSVQVIAANIQQNKQKNHKSTSDRLLEMERKSFSQYQHK